MTQKVGQLVPYRGSYLILAVGHPCAEDSLHQSSNVGIRAYVFRPCRALDRLREGERGSVASVEVARESARDDVVERARYRRSDLLERRYRRAHDLLQDLDRFIAPEEAPPREALPEHDGHRKDVALHRAYASLVDTLGREVREFAFHLVRSRRLDPILGLGDPEICDVRAPVAPDEDVVRRDVPMDDVEGLVVVVPQLVRRVQAAERVEDDSNGDPDVDGASRGAQLSTELGERRALDVIHDDEGHSAFEAELAHLYDARIVDRRGKPRLIHQHADEDLVAREVTVRAFDGDERRPLPLVGRAREVHRGHAARGQLEEELVRPQPLHARRWGRFRDVGGGCRSCGHSAPSKRSMSTKLRRAPDLGYRCPMRIVARLARSSSLLLPVFLLPIACGGGGAESDGAKVATPPAASAGAAAPVADAPTTTTAALADGGDLQGAKLTETKAAVAPAPSASAAPPKGPHAHEIGRGPEDIRAIIMARRDDARACYDAALKDHPGIEGDLVIAWTIDPKGNVTQTSLDSSRSQIAEPSVVACVSDLIKKVQFAASPGGYETRAFYPFNFHPRHGTPSRTP